MLIFKHHYMLLAESESVDISFFVNYTIMLATSKGVTFDLSVHFLTTLFVAQHI